VLLRRSLAVALLLGLLSPVVARAASPKASVCTDSTDEVHGIDTGRFGDAGGQYALPPTTPDGLVVIFHGYGHTAGDWATYNLDDIATANNVVALAMDYPGALDADGVKTDQTWQVKEGAEVSNRAAEWFKAKCAPEHVIAYGVSMGGNASGLALASSQGLYDYWFDIEGADNVVETYHEARALDRASGNAFATAAQHGIEVEMGHGVGDGSPTTFEQNPQAYLDHSNVYRVDDILASGIKGVVIVHAVDDGLVPYNQQREMQAAIAGRVPVQFWTVGSAGRVNGQNAEEGRNRAGDTTIDSYATSNIPGFPPTAPLAGHSNENNEDARVSWLGFDRLHEFFLGVRPDASGDFVYDEDTGQYTKP
jgi:hypothetical protein